MRRLGIVAVIVLWATNGWAADTGGFDFSGVDSFIDMVSGKPMWGITAVGVLGSAIALGLGGFGHGAVRLITWVVAGLIDINVVSFMGSLGFAGATF